LRPRPRCERHTRACVAARVHSATRKRVRSRRRKDRARAAQRAPAVELEGGGAALQCRPGAQRALAQRSARLLRSRESSRRHTQAVRRFRARAHVHAA
jgi:hypothetical protein